VCVAIGEQFLPDRADSSVPHTLPGAALALADKFDTLVMTLAIGERPTGSRDPYGLRRAAAGVVAISLDRALHLDLDEAAALVYRIGASQDAAFVLDQDTAARATSDFVLDRVDTLLVDDGVPIDLVRAARGASGPRDPVAHAQRARALAAAADSDLFADAYNAFTRASRLAAKHPDLAGAPTDPATLVDDADRQLAVAVSEARRVAVAAAGAHDYEAVLAAAASLSGPVDVFFDAVLVMHDDPAVRTTRLRLLIDVTETCRLAGDLSLVQR
jgi:glycyl-tRNA synthetase beta chain